MDFTIIKQVDLQSLKQDFEDILETVNRTSGIIFSVSAFNAGEFTIFANIQFLGPMGFKNKISFDISLKEKLIEKPLQINVKPEYDEIPQFEVLVYSPNEILVEKLRSILQRGKARDYYDVWRLLKEKDFDQSMIGELLIEKCRITGIEFKPELFFDPDRLSEANKFWTIALARLTRDLPDFELIVKDLKSMLDFIPPGE